MVKNNDANRKCASNYFPLFYFRLFTFDRFRFLNFSNVRLIMHCFEKNIDFFRLFLILVSFNDINSNRLFCWEKSSLPLKSSDRMTDQFVIQRFRHNFETPCKNSLRLSSSHKFLCVCVCVRNIEMAELKKCWETFDFYSEQSLTWSALFYVSDVCDSTTKTKIFSSIYETEIKLKCVPRCRLNPNRFIYII